MQNIVEKRLGTPDIDLLITNPGDESIDYIPTGFERGWASRPKRAERGQGGISPDMMRELEIMYEMGESGRSKMSPAQAAEKLKMIENPDGNLKYPVIPELCKIMAVFSSIKKKRDNRWVP